jgi:hypothetical protein
MIPRGPPASRSQSENTADRRIAGRRDRGLRQRGDRQDGDVELVLVAVVVMVVVARGACARGRGRRVGVADHELHGRRRAAGRPRPFEGILGLQELRVDLGGPARG